MLAAPRASVSLRRSLTLSMSRLRRALPLAALAVAPLAGVPGSAWGQELRAPIYTPAAPTPTQQVARDVFSELIGINSSVTTGNITNAALAMAARFRAAGIPERDIFVGGPQPQRHNVVARVRGKNPGGHKPLLLLAHLDVVEALRSDWSPDLDPFSFIERDGFYYGRGTFDDKAMAAIFVANVFRMRAEGWVPDRDIIIALTSDEESGDYNGVGWLLEQHPELVDAGLVINEGADGVLRDGQPFANYVEFAQKVTANYTLHVTNRGGHSSVPRRDNAITALADALAKVGRHDFPIHLTDVTREFLTQTARVEEPRMAQAMRALVADSSDRAALTVITERPEYNTILRTTCVATTLSGGHASNALPQLAEANVNCRIHPTENAASVRDELARVVGDTTVQVLIRTQRSATPTARMRPDVMQAITQTTREIFGDVPVIPMMLAGGTDSRFFRARGVDAYGVSGLFVDSDTDSRIHGRDERIPIKAFFEGQEFLYRLTKRLATDPAAVP